MKAWLILYFSSLVISSECFIDFLVVSWKVLCNLYWREEESSMAVILVVLSLKTAGDFQKNFLEKNAPFKDKPITIHL